MGIGGGMTLVMTDDQAAYLGRAASLEAALRFYGASEETFTSLARNLSIGERRGSKIPEFAGVRVWRITAFENHLGFDLPVPGGVEIVRVLHGHRDLDSILGA